MTIRAVSLSRRVMLGVSIPALPLVISLIAYATSSWNLVTFGNAAGINFMDLTQVTASAECLQLDPTRDLFRQTCDPSGLPYNYPLFWAQFGSILGVTQTSTPALGLLLVILFASSLSLVVWRAMPNKVDLRIYMAVVVAVISPPVFLLLERGNTDTIIFFLLAVAGVLIIRGNRILGSLLLGIAASAKFFPTPSALVLWDSSRRRFAPVAVFLLVLFAGLTINARDLPLIRENTPQPIDMAFGASILFLPLWNIFDLPMPDIGPQISSVILFVILYTFYAWMLYRSQAAPLMARVKGSLNTTSQNVAARTLVVIGLGSFLGSYLLGTNFDYRMVFLIFVLIGLLAQSSQSVYGSAALAWILVVLLWLSYAAPQRMQQFADVVWLLVAPFLALLLTHLALNPQRKHHEQSQTDAP